nr:hypothetical protein [Tanacetum cinerariifolium]
MDVPIKQDDLNQKFLTSLAPEWLVYTIVCRNRDDLDTMSLDDVYNHLKVYEPDVQKIAWSNSQNMAFISSSNTNSGKKSPRSQDRGKRESYKKDPKMEELAPKATIAIDESLRDIELKDNKIKYLRNELVEVKKEKESIDFKIKKFKNASKDLDRLLESQKLDKDQKGVGFNEYCVVPPPPTQVYSPPKKDMSWMGLREFVDDTVTDYTRPTPSIDVSKSDMTGNISYLSEYEPFNEGYVSFGHGRGKITGKGSIKTVRSNLVKGFPSKRFTNDHSCVACLKGKQHKAFRKSKLVYSISKPFHTLHMDLFGPTSVSSLNHKWYCLAVTDDFSRNKEMDEFCSRKGIKREFSNARTPQQNGVAERRNRTLIEAARTMLADAKLHVTFWAEAVNIACYVQNKVLVIKPYNKTPYELFNEISSAIGFLRPFRCHVMILNTLNHLGKFDAKGDEGTSSTNILGTKEDVHQVVKEKESPLRFIALPNWFHEAQTTTSNAAATKDDAIPDNNAPQKEQEEVNGGKEVPESSGNSNLTTSIKVSINDSFELASSSTVETEVPTVSTLVPTGSLYVPPVTSSIPRIILRGGSSFPEPLSLGNAMSFENRLEDFFRDTSDEVSLNDVEADLSNMETTTQVSPTLTLRIHNDHPKSQIIGLVDTPVQTRQKTKNVEEQSFIATIHQKTNPDLLQYCLFSCFLSQEEPKKIVDAFKDLSWVEAMQQELLQFKIHMVWVLVDCPKGPPEDPEFPHRFYKVEKAMYGLHQALRAWYGTLSKYLLDNGFQRGKDGTGKDMELHLYRFMIGSLMYLTASRPDIMFVVCACARHQVTPKKCHLHVVKRIFRYLKCHPKLGLWYPKESPFDLVAYSDSDYGGVNQDRKSTTGDDNIADLLTKAFNVRRFQYLVGGDSGNSANRLNRDPVSKVPSPGAAETAFLIGDARYREALPAVTHLDVGQDRENSAKTSAMPHEASPRVTSLGGGKGSMQQKLQELMDICTSLQRQHSLIEERGVDQGEDLLVEDTVKDSDKSADKGYDSTDNMANVLGTLGATNILVSGGLSVVTPTTRETRSSRGVVIESLSLISVNIQSISKKDKGKGKMTEPKQPSKEKVLEQMSAQLASDLEAKFAQEDQIIREQDKRDSEIAKIQVESELKMMIAELDRSNEIVTKYLTGSESRPPMLNKENYVPWSSRLLWYAKSRPNGKLIHNSILNGPYVRRMIPEPGDANRDVNVTETFHEQTDDELSKKELKQIESDYQAIQTILLGLPEDIYAAVDSCETAQEIWLRNYLQQPMPNPKDIIDSTTTMNMALALMAKAFKLNYSTPTNNNQRISSNPRNRQIAQPSMNMGQDRQMQMVGGNGRNQFRQYAGNLNGYNTVQNVGNQGVGHFARDCTVRPRRRDAAYLQTKLLIAQKEEAGIQLQAEEYDLMAAAADLDEIEEYTEILEPILESHQVPHNDNDVISENLAIEVEKVNSVNHKLKETNADLTTKLAGYKNQERCFEISQEKYDKLERCYQQFVYAEQCLSKKINALHVSSGKQIMTLNEQISKLNKQLSKEKSTVSFLLEEKKKLKSDFKTCKDELLDKQSLLEKKIKALNNIVVKTGYQNPFYLKQAQKNEQSLYDGKVLLAKYDPIVVHDSEETLQLAQESREKMKQMNTEIKPANYTKINHLSGIFVPQTVLSREELYFLNNSKMANVSKSISIPNEDLSDDTTPSVARKFVNEVKSTIVTLQRVVKQRMTIETHNWASSAHQEFHKIVREENFPIVNQVDARVQNFKIQFLKEAAKFVGDFKSLAKEADASLAKHKIL